MIPWLPWALWGATLLVLAWNYWRSARNEMELRSYCLLLLFSDATRKLHKKKYMELIQAEGLGDKRLLGMNLHHAVDQHSQHLGKNDSVVMVAALAWDIRNGEKVQ